MFAVLVTVLCLMSVGHSAPLDCEKPIQTLDQVDPLILEGTWALVAGSLKHDALATSLKSRDSVTIQIRNFTYTQANRFGDDCQYHHRNLSLEGQTMKMTMGNFSFTPTYYNTSCPDCLLLTMETKSPNYNSMDVYLLSKRRQLEKAEMDEFVALVECLKMPTPIVMDPAKDLCPEKTSGPEDQTGKET